MADFHIARNDEEPVVRFDAISNFDVMQGIV
jgi:hypothetical protein